MSRSWDIKLAFDDQVMRTYDFARRAQFILGRYAKKFDTARNIELRNKHAGERCFLVGNGPSIKQQDLSLLEGHTVLACNYFFHHPDIEKISPKYYAIYDGKLETGEWPVSMLDEVLERCPDVTFMLNGHWRRNPKINRIAERAPVYWVIANQMTHMNIRGPIDLTRGIYGFNVMKVALFSATYMGFSEICLLGIDNNGTFLDALELSSHFYDAEAEKKDLERDLWQVAQGFRGWAGIEKRFRGSQHHIVNMTKGGLLYWFERADYETYMATLNAGSASPAPPTGRADGVPA